MVGPFFKKWGKAFSFSAVSVRHRNIHKACGDSHRSPGPDPATQWMGPYAHTHEPMHPSLLSYETPLTKHNFK